MFWNMIFTSRFVSAGLLHGGIVFIQQDNYLVVTINNFKIGELTQKLYDTLTGIQWGKLEDKYGWTTPIE